MCIDPKWRGVLVEAKEGKGKETNKRTKQTI